MTPHDQTIAEIRGEVARLKQLLEEKSPTPPGAGHSAHEQWQSAFDAIPDLIALIDTGHRIVRVNRALADALHMVPEEAVGKPCHRIIHGSEKPHPSCPHVKLLIDGREHHADVYVAHLGGHFNFTTSPLFDSAGGMIGCVHVARNINQLKQTERELRDSEERYRALVETTADWIWEVDGQGRYVYASPQVREILGYEPEEVIGRTPFDFMTEEEAWRVGEIFNDIAEDRRPFTALENVNRHRDGRLITLETSGVPVFDQGGDFRGYRGIDRDISFRRQEREILLARLRLLEYSFTHTLGDLLRATLDEAEQLTGSQISFCHFLADDQKSLSLQAWSTRTTGGFCNSVSANTHYDIADAGVWADCVRERRAIIHNNYAKLPGRKGMPDGHPEVVRELVVPVFRGNRIVAVFGVGNKPTEYVDQDIDVVELLADLAWDVADHKIVEEQLRSSEERLALAQTSAGTGLWDWDLTSGRLTWSRELFQLFGLDPDHAEATAETWRRVVHPDDLAAAAKMIDEAVRNGTLLHNECRIVLPDGQIRWLNIVGRTYCDQEMRPVRMTGICLDISDRVRIDQALRDSENLFRTLCDAAPIGIFRTDQNLQTVYRNPRWCEIFGIAGAEATDYHWLDAVHPDDRERARSTWREATTVGRPYACEYRVTEDVGRERWVKSLASPIRNPDGSNSGYVGTVEDISEARHAREEHNKNQKLESLGVLAGGIAHDFNNILTAIVGSLSLARFHQENPEEVCHLLADAESAAIQAKSLTQQLLTFARGGEPVKQVIGVGDLLTKSTGFASRGSSVRCVYSLDENLWPVEADEGQLSQVFHNLTINAVQAMPVGGTLTIRTRNLRPPEREGRWIEITVSDTGIGIAEGDLRKIFDPYFSTKPEGSGLGLATCHSIVTQHGGTITVSSTVGEGSTFTVTLPASEQELNPSPEEGREVTRGAGRVLVMDDERPVRKVAQAMLQSLGYYVECAVDGDDAVDRYQQRLEEGNPFDVTIMDLTVPGGRGGKEAVKELLRIDPSAKVVVSSGYSAESVLAGYRQFGFCAILGKPYRLQELGEVLRELLSSAS